ncbi:MAG: 4-hydroxythreonine-4-phosphate dehydrogenase PdxA [Verrucomicrobiota bacterium]
MKSTPQEFTVGITLGDPAGIGPEIIYKALEYFSQLPSAPKFRVIGTTEGTRVGFPSKISAHLAFDALEESVELLRKKEIHAVVNAPVSKANLSKVGFRFPGQTEFYAKRFKLKPTDVTMMMVSDRLRVSLVSTHCSLKESVKLINTKRVFQTIDRTLKALTQLGIFQPKVAVCGLNPHAGEEGLFGKEEKRFILPAIQKFKRDKRGMVSGPYSPDAIFREALKGDFNAVVCMYHDQGLIPLKLVGFETGVNLTLGLPFWRSSPDHGTAFDIAGKGKASPSSIIHAIRLLSRLSVRSG